MIVIQGFTFTDQGETLDYHEKFRLAYGAVAEPICERCKKVTDYAVFDANPNGKDRPSLALIGLNQGAYIKWEGKVFYPHPICHRCEAARAGWHCGKFSPESYYRQMESMKTATLTPDERVEYSNIFNASFKKVLETVVAAAKDQGSRYKAKV